MNVVVVVLLLSCLCIECNIGPGSEDGSHFLPFLCFVLRFLLLEFFPFSSFSFYFRPDARWTFVLHAGHACLRLLSIMHRIGRLWGRGLWGLSVCRPQQQNQQEQQHVLRLSFCLSVCQPMCLSVRPSVCMYVGEFLVVPGLLLWFRCSCVCWNAEFARLHVLAVL